METEEQCLRFRDNQAIGYKEGFVWILKPKRKSCILIY